MKRKQIKEKENTMKRKVKIAKVKHLLRPDFSVHCYYWDSSTGIIDIDEPLNPPFPPMFAANLKDAQEVICDKFPNNSYDVTLYISM